MSCVAVMSYEFQEWGGYGGIRSGGGRFGDWAPSPSLMTRDSYRGIAATAGEGALRMHFRSPRQRNRRLGHRRKRMSCTRRPMATTKPTVITMMPIQSRLIRGFV